MNGRRLILYAVVWCAVMPLVADGAGGACAPDPEIALTVRGRYALADTPHEVKVSVKTRSEKIRAGWRYALCGSTGGVLCRYSTPVSDKPARLAVNLPAGRYRVSVMDGAHARCSETLYMFPGTNRFLAADACPVIREPPQPEPKSDWARLWHDFRTGERLPATLPYVAPRRVAFRYEAVARAALPPEKQMARWQASADDLCADIDHAAAGLLRCGANLLIMPPVFGEDRDLREIWIAKMKRQGIALVFDENETYASSLVAGDVATLLLPAKAAVPASRPFAAAYRSLPPAAFTEKDRRDDVSLRVATVDGRAWFYVLNTGTRPRTVALSVPASTREPARDARVGGWLFGRDVPLTLAPGELRAFVAPDAYGVFSEKN